MFYLFVRTEKLSKIYGRHAAVHDLTLEVEPGEVFGLLGTSGAGKTTIVRMLLDFIRPTSGRALIHGKEVHKHSAEIRKQVGYLPASFSLNGTMTGEACLRFLASLRDSVSWQYACDLSDRLGLCLGRKFADFSLAEQKKLGLVQAFMHRPELLILDEPTLGLDAEAKIEVFHMVAEARREGRSVLFATQSLYDVERVCDRAAILNQGHLITVERAVRLRSRSLRRVEMRFAGPVSRDLFAGLRNVENISLEDNLLRCTVRGDPDGLIKAASQYRVTDILCLQPGLDEVVNCYYGVGTHAT